MCVLALRVTLFIPVEMMSWMCNVTFLNRHLEEVLVVSRAGTFKCVFRQFVLFPSHN